MYPKRKCLSSYLVVFNFCCQDTFPFWRKWCDSPPSLLPLPLSLHCFWLPVWISVCVCVFLVVLLHTFNVTLSHQRRITSWPLFRVRDHTTAQAWLHTDLTVPSNMSLTKAENSKLIEASWQVNENELLINQTDVWHNISPVINNQNSWKSPSQTRGRWWGGWGCRSRSLSWWTHPLVVPWCVLLLFLHHRLPSAPRSG